MALGTFLEEAHIVDINARKQERESLRQRRHEWEAQIEDQMESVYDAIANAITAIREINAEYLEAARGENASEVVYRRLKHLVDNFPY